MHSSSSQHSFNTNFEETPLSERLKRYKMMKENGAVAEKKSKLKLFQKSAGKRTAKTTTTRKRVARPEDIEFTTPLRKKSKSSPEINYLAGKSRKTKSVKRKVKTKTASTQKSGVKTFLRYLGWMTCAALLMRLVLADGGVWDFYKMEQVLEKKEKELGGIIGENKSLIKEIKMIKSNISYQKKLARDHLGVISRDEFLILFAKEKAPPST